MKYSVLKKIREEHRMTQEELSKKIGISKQTLINIEKGESDLKAPQIKKLSEMFELSCEVFIDNKLPKEPVINITGKGISKNKESNIRIDIPQKNIDKFKEVLIYMLNKIGAKSNVGETVLYKLLYFIDFDFYEKYEKQLMGNSYIKNHFGPTPTTFTSVVTDMMVNNEVVRVEDEFYGKPQKKYLPKREANLSILNADEIKHIDNVLHRLSDLTASQISEYSHKDIPWIGTDEGQEIPYESVFYRTKETSVRSYED